MTSILAGVRILEVAEHTFVPAESALLADLGAEVIKIEHATRGDAMRGLASTGVAPVPGNVHALLEHSIRGKKSLGCRTADGMPFRLVAAPVQYDEVPATPARAPGFSEHGDAILGELGFDWDAIVDLKVRGIVA